MQLFEILQDGYHTPLTATQIAELFNAGRLGRHTPCKPAARGEWHTIDELFPLLKYHAPWRLAYQSPQPRSEYRFRRGIVMGVGLAVATAALIAYVSLQPKSSNHRRITTIDPMPSSSLQSDDRPAPVLITQPVQIAPKIVPPSTTSVFSGSSGAPVVVRADQPPTQPAIRLVEAQRIADQARRDQAAREQQRIAKEQRAVEQQKLTGRDEHLPLDQWRVVNVGGESVSVKIHDNDVTSFNLWINYGPRREVKKEKGLTGSGTDEILIYTNGRASLYYVWEISELGHCMLRVREA